MMSKLLPPNKTPLEVALADAGELGVDAEGLRMVADSERCPAHLLPWLAWAWSVDDFNAASNEERQRALIRSSLRVHQRKGTVAAVRQVFRDLGLGEVDIEEGRSGYRRDGKRRREAYNRRGLRGAHWAEYRVICYSLLTNQQAKIARTMLEGIAASRCRLVALDFSRAALTRNGYGKRDGVFSRGQV
ncbi:phage tail protein I [Chromobacterium haemolyticum]|uniref:Phage tail protein I n=1 Tax=Chromobacterium fluminis TaxID=3044269 RepID=A0ABX0LF66_9NEIS|nr:phage tail protein I [Chromobacterium haemolyticum]